MLNADIIRKGDDRDQLMRLVDEPQNVLPSLSLGMKADIRDLCMRYRFFLGWSGDHGLWLLWAVAADDPIGRPRPEHLVAWLTDPPEKNLQAITDGLVELFRKSESGAGSRMTISGPRGTRPLNVCVVYTSMSAAPLASMARPLSSVLLLSASPSPAEPRMTPSATGMPSPGHSVVHGMLATPEQQIVILSNMSQSKANRARIIQLGFRQRSF